MAAAQDDPPGGATRAITTAPVERQPLSSSGGRHRRLGLLAWWLAPLLYLAWLIHNALPLLPRLPQTAPSALLAQLIALPSLPAIAGVAAPSQAVAALPALVAVCVAFLTIVLLALTLTPRPVLSAAEPGAISAPERAPRQQPAAPEPAASAARAAAATAAADALPDAPPRQRLVFISHASGDNVFGVALADWLQAQLGPGWIVWYDSHGAPDAKGEWPNGIPPASDWMQEIQRQALSCDVFVVIETRAAMDSYWVQQEVELAWTRKPGASVEAGLVVVPVLRETCDILPLLSLVQSVRYLPGVEEATAQRDLLYAVRFGRTRPAPPVTVGPPFDLSVLRPADHFIGRAANVEWVIARLTDPADTRLGALANIAAANGQGGIGKTALAAEVVRRLMATFAFPDGIAALDCRDQRTEADALGLLQTALSRFTPGRQKPQDEDFATLGAVAQRLLGGKRALVVFDNVEAELPASKLVAALRTAGAAVLLTSRAPLPAAQGASLRLDLLPEEDALALFLATYGEPLGRALTDAERTAAHAIVVALGRHTLAVKLAAANAATQQRPLAPLAAEFQANPLRDAWLEDSETAVAFVLASSVAAMSAGGQRLFAALGAFASADVGRRAALALAEALGDDQTAAERSLRSILDLRLADPAEIELPGGEQADRERLRLHPLTQAYARDLFAGHRAQPAAAARWDDAQREQADRAIASWYADYTNAAPELALTPDEANISGALDWALAHGDDRAAARICNGMRGFWRDTGRTQAGLRYLPLGAAAADRIADESGQRADRRRQANITAYLGDILSSTGRLPEAEAIFQQDLALRRETQDRQGEGADLSNLGQVALARGDLAAAARYFEQSLPVLRETQDRQGEGVVLSNLGQVALQRGDLAAAAAYFEQALVIDRETQDRRGEGVVLSNLGQVEILQGEFEKAVDYFQQSLPIMREMQDRQGEGALLRSLGQVEIFRGRLDDAMSYLEQALAIHREVESRQDEGIELTSLALTLARRGEYDRAIALSREGIAILRDVGDQFNSAAELSGYGTLLLQHSDDRAGGVAAFAESIMLWQTIGLADREQQAREWALALGCRADELPPPRQAAGG